MSGGQTLQDVRVLAVGASSGIGRSFAATAMEQGASVCVTARRGDLLEKLCAETGTGTPIVADVADADDCRRIVDEAMAAMGGIDLLVFTVGAGRLSHIDQPDPEDWLRAYSVNTLGPVLVTAAALPHLGPDSLVAFTSSESAGETRWGMSSYQASKAALDSTIKSWRNEHPERRFMRVVMGATIGTDFGAEFDNDLLGVAFERWIATGISMTLMEAENVGRHLAEVLAVAFAHPTVDVPDLVIDPRGQAWQ
jgi:NAD(P)-dependent dehydrogenase (short-subunit alcohol dehydrogenase family)